MLKILVIEDDVIDQLALTRLIKKNSLNCKLIVSTKIQEALDLMDLHTFDLVICDLNLPDGNAFDLKTLIRKQPFILLSGHIDTEITERAIQFGAIQILQKSSELTQLTSISTLIKNMMSSKVKEAPIQQTSFDSTNSKFNIDILMKTFDNNVDEVFEIIQLFVSGNPKLLADIESAIDTEDRNTAKNLLHRLKSNCKMIGLNEQFIITERLEQLSNHEVLPILKKELELLKSSFETAISDLKTAILTLRT